MAAALGDPQFDPHGARLVEPGPLAPGGRTAGAVGDKLTVVEVDDHDPELLRYLGKMGLYPGTKILLIAYAPFNGPLTLAIGDEECTLGYQAAKSIIVAAQKD
jgi:DtxR family Mn-dependent transcriptional regulator